MPSCVSSLCLPINCFVIYATRIVGKIEVTIHIPNDNNGMDKISTGLSQFVIEIANVTINTINEVKSNM